MGGGGGPIDPAGPGRIGRAGAGFAGIGLKPPRPIHFAGRHGIYVKTTLRLLYLRARANWRLLSVVGFGILIASVLMASTTLYTRALTDLGLEFDLERASGETAFVRVDLFQGLAGGERNDEILDFIDGSMAAHLEGVATPGPAVRAYEVGEFHLLGGNSLGRNANFGVALTSVDGWESRVEFEGRAPAAPALRFNPDSGLTQLDGPLEVAIPRRHAEFAGVSVGDRIAIADAYDECDREPPLPDGSPPPNAESCQTSAVVTLRVAAEVVGVFEARNPEDPYWRASISSLVTPIQTAHFSLLPAAALFVHSDAFRETIGRIMPGYGMHSRLHSFVPVTAFDSVDIPADLGRIEALRDDVASFDGAVFTPLDGALTRFELNRDFSVVPILLILIQVVAIVFFFIVVMARLLISREAEEIILLRGRGASLIQVLGLYTVQLTPIVLLAAVVAPLIAAGAISALGFVPVFEDVTGDDWIPMALTPQAWALALAGAVIAVGAVLIPVTVAAHVRPGAARYVAARPAGTTIIQRYYLDIGFLAVAGFLVWAVSERDAVFTRDTVGGLATDPIVLIAPALIGLIAIILVLRLLPVVLGAVAWAVRDRVAMPVAAALRQAVRNPGPIARLSLLLMLAAALGTFAASYGGTVERSFEERERYEAGADLRSPLPEDAPGVLRRALATLPGSSPSALAVRRLGSSSATGRGESVQLLGVESQRAASFLWFRDDFTDRPPAEILPALAPSPSLGGIALPDETTELSVWVLLSRPRDDITFWLQLRDADGRFFRAELGAPVGAGEWTELRARAVSGVGASRARRPFTLHAVTYTEGQNRSISDPGTVLIDDVTAYDSDGEATLLAGFESAGVRWRLQPLGTSGVPDTIGRRTDGVAHSGRGAMEYSWSAGVSPGRRGIYLPGPNLCDEDGICALNVIASNSFLRVHGAQIGGIVPFRLGSFSIDVRIIDAVDFFPTLDPNDQGGFLVADVADLYHLGSTLTFRDGVRISEAWVSGPSDPGLRERTILALNVIGGELGVIDQQASVDAAADDPLVAAGGSGILLVSFIAVGILIIVAFLVSVIFTAHERMLEMAVLRTLGIGRRALLGQLIVEYGIVAIVGLGLGTFLGDQIGRLMLRFLEVDEFGDRVLPPFALTTDWTTVGLAYLVLIGVLGAGVAIAWRLFIRESITRSLRLAV